MPKRRNAHRTACSESTEHGSSSYSSGLPGGGDKGRLFHCSVSLPLGTRPSRSERRQILSPPAKDVTECSNRKPKVAGALAYAKRNDRNQLETRNPKLETAFMDWNHSQPLPDHATLGLITPPRALPARSPRWRAISTTWRSTASARTAGSAASRDSQGCRAIA
jgi:hypothetical protein